MKIKRFTSHNKIDPDPLENIDPVVFLNTKHVHDDKYDGNQDVDEGQSIEELRCNKKS